MTFDFARVAGICALLAALDGLLYSVAFVVLKNSGLAGACLLVGGVLTIIALAGLRELVAPAGPGLATAAFALAVAAGLGAAAHGGYDLANAIHPPPGGIPDAPSQVDPRGLLTFGFAGLAAAGFATLIGATRAWPRGLALLGYLTAVLLVIVYLARLIILSPSNPLVLGPAALAGLIVNPAWYAWLGVTMLRSVAR
ncbi:MAG: hypothetical protein E6I08_08685 [Chloroflexi bacterium]|nr:MAG: hypothetical protein E6I08_08685 [Chloroflexota bacterium]